MEINIMEIVDQEWNVLVSYDEENMQAIVNNSCKLEIVWDKMLLMIKDYKSPHDEIKLVW